MSRSTTDAPDAGVPSERSTVTVKVNAGVFSAGGAGAATCGSDSG
jgi:hypothetical protein